MSADNRLHIWTVYQNTRDYPGQFVARRWLNDSPTDTLLTAPSLLELRGLLPPDLYRLPRAPEDDPCIVEVWL